MADSPPPVNTGWEGAYKDRLGWAENAPTPELRKHFEDELRVMEPTMRALGLGDIVKPLPGVGGGNGGPPPIKLEYNHDNKPPPIDTSTGTGKGTHLTGNIPPELEKYRKFIEEASEKSGVPANLIAAIIWQESRGNFGATSTNGGNGLTDTGLMQINPNTFESIIKNKHPELGSLNDPGNNIKAGAYYIAYLKEKFGSWEGALRAYNSGENGVDKGNWNNTPAGTGDPTYVRKVMEFLKILDSGNGTLPP